MEAPSLGAVEGEIPALVRARKAEVVRLSRRAMAGGGSGRGEAGEGSQRV